MAEGEQWGFHTVGAQMWKGLHGDGTEMPTKVDAWDLPSSYGQESKAVIVMPTHGSPGESQRPRQEEEKTA